MAKIVVKGLDEFKFSTDQISGGFQAVASAAVYAGAGEMVECIKTAINSLPTQNGYMKSGDKRNVVTADEKKDLVEHVGISHFDTTGGSVTAAIGFNGYSRHHTAKYPNGVPIPMIARSIESGSSVRQKNPFLRKAVNSNKEAISRAMQEAAQKKLEELTK